MLLALLAFMPPAFGVVHAWSEQIVVTLAAGMGVVLGIRLLLAPQTRFAWSWAYLPVAAFLAVAVIQLLPLPPSLVRFVSPHTASLQTELLGDLPHSGDLLSSMTLSFYPRATRHDLRLALAVVTIFVVVVNFYRDPARIKRLLTALAALGGGIALLALAQDLAGNGKIFWVVPTYGRIANSGPFINHSHYGQFMNLSIGAALGLLLVRLHESFAGRTVTPARVAEYLSSPQARTTKLLLAMIVVAVATVFLSLTRGGMISMLIAAGFTTLMLSWRQSLRGRGWITVLLALGAFLCVLYVGFDEVYNRLATLQEINRIEGGRWQIVKDIALAWTRFPIFGVGLGTHEVVYPMFDRSTLAAWAMHAENEYAQAAEETGLVGLLPLVLFGIAVWVSYARATKVSSTPIHAATYGLGFGLLAILIHSLSDFGQHLPANAVLTAVTCGLLVALSRMDQRDGKKVRTEEGRSDEEEGGKVRTEEGRRDLLPSDLLTFRPSYLPTVAVRTVGLVIVAGVFAWSVFGADRARTAEWHWNRVRAAEPHLEALQWRLNEPAYEYLFSHAIAAVEAEPDNVYYRHWLSAYEWLSLAPYTDPNTGALKAEALPWARQIVEDLHDARSLCPTFGATYCLAGEIEKFVLADSDGAGHIRTGYRLAPCDATACFAAARCDAGEGRFEEAFEKLTRAVQLEDRLFPRAVAMCLDELGRGDLALALAGDHPSRLAYVGNALTASGKALPASPVATTSFDTNEGSDLAGQAQTKAFEQLKQQCERPDVPASAHASLASYYRRQGDTEAAIQQYRRALMKDYDQVGWHFTLAQLLARADRVDEALREARICLRLRADHAAAKSLMEQLSVRLKKAGRPRAAGN
jgi:O-antigen ligase/tetratricopeptide (TPR) repeat protein